MPKETQKKMVWNGQKCIILIKNAKGDNHTRKKNVAWLCV